MTATETRSPRAGGRSARQALRSAPRPETMRPVRPGLSGGTYNPMTEASVARICQAAMDALEQTGLADAPPSGVAIMMPPALLSFSFRHAPAGTADLDARNRRLVDAVNADGRTCLTRTMHQDSLVIRFQVGQFDTTEADVMFACDAIGEIARGLP